MSKQTVYMKKPKNVSTVKAIRKKCLECRATAHSVTFCPVDTCPLWAYRFGLTPNTAIARLEKHCDVKILEE